MICEDSEYKLLEIPFEEILYYPEFSKAFALKYFTQTK